MTVVHKANISGSPDHFSVSCDGVILNSDGQGGASVISVTGDIDALNVRQLVDYVRHFLSGDRPVVIDLTELDFFGAEGILALFEIDEQCGGAGLEWALVPSRLVSRLLRICDTDARLPTVSSVSEALEGFSSTKRPRRLLKLVTKTG